MLKIAQCFTKGRFFQYKCFVHKLTAFTTGMEKKQFKRTQKQKNEDFRIICDQRARGKTFEEITAYLNSIRPYTLQTPSNFKLYQSMIGRQVELDNKPQEIIDQMVYDLEALMSKCLQEFDRSRDDKIIITESGKVSVDTGKLVDPTRTIQTMPREGNSKYLEIYLRTLIEKAKLKGVYDSESSGVLNDLISALKVDNRHAPKSKPIQSEEAAKELDRLADDYTDYEDLDE